MTGEGCGKGPLTELPGPALGFRTSSEPRVSPGAAVSLPVCEQVAMGASQSGWLGPRLLMIRL